MSKYGIKEVADVDLYKIDSNTPLVVIGEKVYNKETSAEIIQPTLSLRGLKSSNLEIMGDVVEARGGKGNPALISWNYNKEVNLSMEDAVLETGALEALTGTEKQMVVAKKYFDDVDKALLKSGAFVSAKPYIINTDNGYHCGDSSEGVMDLGSMKEIFP